MNKIVPSHTSQTASGTLVFAIGAAIAVGQPAWPLQEMPSYVITQTTSSYSQVSEQVINAAKQNTQIDFSHKVAAIYVSLSERQERLGAEIEEAIFNDLDSLYES
ncbi:MAG: hypothetical protein GY761_19765 [Hyphomicrobiales bacterium]|nr:hypothetical protein [Hyphomicrobiales bacterium]